MKFDAEQFAIRSQQARRGKWWKAAMADNGPQEEFIFELPAFEFCNSQSRSGDKF